MIVIRMYGQVRGMCRECDFLYRAVDGDFNRAIEALRRHVAEHGSWAA